MQTDRRIKALSRLAVAMTSLLSVVGCAATPQPVLSIYRGYMPGSHYPVVVFERTKMDDLLPALPEPLDKSGFETPGNKGDQQVASNDTGIGLSAMGSDAGASGPLLPKTWVENHKADIKSPHQVTRWVAHAGATLKESVQDWANVAGWKMLWAPKDLDYPIVADLIFNGSFQDAIKGVFQLYQTAQRPFEVHGSLIQHLLYVKERKQ